MALPSRNVFEKKEFEQNSNDSYNPENDFIKLWDVVG